jgi:alpha-L-arabinofuranosidase
VSTDIPAEIHLHGFSAGGEAKIQVLNSNSLADSNSEESPSNVTPVESVESVTSAGWKHLFPHASLTVIVLKRR